MSVTDEIKMVHTATFEGGDWAVKCPHCEQVLYVEGPVRGEQYTHKSLVSDAGCGGMFEVSSTATLKGV